jgi:hypothetical protein
LEEAVRKEEAKAELKERELTDERSKLKQTASTYEEQLRTKDLEIR